MALIAPKDRAPGYDRFVKPTPKWFKDAKFGIFVHYGAYSVPAWAEPTGKLGEVPWNELYPHNPYSEWYFNTIRFKNCPAAQHHAKVYSNAPYDQFLDDWKAEDFDADALMKVFKRAGANFFIPVTKHHDGITLWDAPGDKGRNTVQRGPIRDFVAEWARACKANDVELGLYYSTGVDWHVWPTAEPWNETNMLRPGIDDHAYNQYAYKQCEDLIERYHPRMLWSDIDWPKAGVALGPYSLANLFEKFYAQTPDGVVNDRWGDTHWDYKVVEYAMGDTPEPGETWQYTRGIGLSFGYNQVEDESNSMSGHEAVKLLISVVSRGGSLLLNVGPDARGNIPAIQLKCLEELGAWQDQNDRVWEGSDVVASDIAKPVGDDEHWQVMWLSKEGKIYGFFDGPGTIKVNINIGKIDLATAKTMSGKKAALEASGGSEISLDMDQFDDWLLPICISFDML